MTSRSCRCSYAATTAASSLRQVRASLGLCVGRPRRAYDADTRFIHVPRARAKEAVSSVMGHHYIPPGRFRFRPTRQ
jgi:hypothetical protein